MCPECYSSDNRITPLLEPELCLNKHLQYICGTCGRCICINHDMNKLRRWNFPFKTLEIAKLYLRTADVTMKKSCGIYKMKNSKGREFYRIFTDDDAMKAYVRRSEGVMCQSKKPEFKVGQYKEYPSSQIRRLDSGEIEKYISEMQLR